MKNVILGINVFKGGHAWIGHGLLVRSRDIKVYDSKTSQYKYTQTEAYYYILCNWGWSGNDNGYYLSNVFNAAGHPTYDENGTPTRAVEYDGVDVDGNYQYNIEAITGIRK